MQLVSVLTQYSKLDRPFTYYYKGDDLVVGVRVFTDFRNRDTVGYVVGVESTNLSIDEATKSLGVKLKEIGKVLDNTPLLTGELLELSELVTSYYLTNKIHVLNAMLPPSLRPSKGAMKAPKIAVQTFAHYEKEFTDFDTLRPVDLTLLNEIISSGSVIRKAANKIKLDRLIKAGAIYFEEKEKYRLKYEKYDTENPKTLSKHQQKAVDLIKSDNNETFLLHGITGSGKTEIYLSLAAEYLNDGREVLILVPEIALTGMMLSSFYKRFGRRIAILHSDLTPAEKYDEYRRIKNGEVRIVVGTRSAVFAPLQNIGLIVIDEEHSETYKQDNAPFYHALIVAQMRAKSFNAKVLLGSATPSIETMARAKKGVYGYYYLNRRIFDTKLPNTELVNMNERKNILVKTPHISRPLQEALKLTLAKNEQAIILVNRRGYAPVVRCRSCGLVKKCETCDLSLTYHKTDKLLKCHHCGRVFEVNAPCFKCGATHFSFTGFGTQKAEEDLANLFPDARILRLDSDVRAKTKSLQQVLDQFMNHEADILVGTQMVAKGHDFPLVSLVGVIGVDANLMIPSFRSAERTFQLITQAIGRSGRQKEVGQALIQTTLTHHYVINYAKDQDYLGFYNAELRHRKLTQNPPLYFLLSITLSHQNEVVIHETIQQLKYTLTEVLKDDAIILGPNSSFYPQSGKLYNETLLVKYRNYFKIKPHLLAVLRPFKEESGLYVEINVDPLDV